MKKTPLILVGFATATLTVLFAASALMAEGEPKSTEKPESRLEALAKFTKVLSISEKYYVDELTISELMEKSIEGLMTNLDAHSAFLNQSGFDNLKVQTKGEFGGLGITVGMKDGALTVIAPIEGTPADRAGLEAGDIILKIEEQPTLNMTIDEAVGMMRGTPKTPINITIVRKGEPKPFVVNIIRDIIKIDSVYTKTYNDEYVYLRVTNFDQKVAAEVAKAIKRHDASTRGYILDLRNNPGGLLDQAVDLVDLFVDDGVIVSQKGRDERENRVYSASSSATLTEKPLVVLINEGSASASEIVSGALQDHHRGVLIGQKTFGKGSVQVILPISGTEAIKLTVARYYLPSGRTIQAVGVTPDVLVQRGKVPEHDDNAYAIKEADLKMHLENELKKLDDNETVVDGEDENLTRKTIITQKQVSNDIQLKEALDILKALSIFKGDH